jgi:hypothetical protein
MTQRAKSVVEIVDPEEQEFHAGASMFAKTLRATGAGSM